MAPKRVMATSPMKKRGEEGSVMLERKSGEAGGGGGGGAMVVIGRKEEGEREGGRE